MDSEFLCAARKGALLCKKIEEECATKTILAVASGMPRRQRKQAEKYFILQQSCPKGYRGVHLRQFQRSLMEGKGSQRQEDRSKAWYSKRGIQIEISPYFLYSPLRILCFAYQHILCHACVTVGVVKDDVLGESFAEGCNSILSRASARTTDLYICRQTLDIEKPHFHPSHFVHIGLLIHQLTVAPAQGLARDSNVGIPPKIDVWDDR